MTNDSPIQPQWIESIPHCSTDDCCQYDGKRCRVMGFRPSTLCQPAVSEMAQKVQNITRERDEARICIQIVRDRVQRILDNWMRPPGGQQAGIPDKSISISTCHDLLRSLGPDQGSYTYEEWLKLVDRIVDLEQKLKEK